MSTASATATDRRHVAPRQRNRAWNPEIRVADAFALVVDWEGTPGMPASIPFVGAGPVDFSHAGRKAIGRGWAAPAFGLKIIATVDNTHHGRLLHVSVSHPAGMPPWPVMIAIKRLFYPADVAAAMIAPEEAAYVNVHPNVLHWWQLPEKWDIG